MTTNIIAKDKGHLHYLIKQAIELNGNDCNLNHIDTSLMTDMNSLFFNLQFNGNISSWDVSNVKDMTSMFYNSQFNGDISNWNTSNVTNMSAMFYNSLFDGNISSWNVGNVTAMQDIFLDCSGEKPWWAIENNQQRKIAISHYQLMKKLDNKLHIKEEQHHFKINKI